MKTAERETARWLRQEEGRSVKEIASLLSVSRSSVSAWVRDIELTADQHESLRQRNPAHNQQLSGRVAWAARCRELRKSWQAEGRETARQGDQLHTAGCMLYWAEGEKGRNRLGFCNADPHVHGFFVAFLRTHFSVPNERLRVWCHLFADHADRQRDIEQFWLDTLALPRVCLWKSTVNVYSRQSQRKRVNKVPYGTCKLILGDTRVVQSIFGAIQEYGGFERPEWLG
jgi:hypothetical protein